MLEDLRPPENTGCKVAREAAKLSSEDQEILEAAFADPRWTMNALTEALNERGFNVGYTAMKKHKVGACACAR